MLSASRHLLVQGIIDAQSEILGLGVGAPVFIGFAWLVVLRFFAKTGASSLQISLPPWPSHTYSLP